MKDTRKLKKKARKLRKKGYTYPEIQERMSVHRTTLSKWCKDIELTPKQIDAQGDNYKGIVKGAEANHVKRQKEIEKIRAKARKGINSLSPYEFKLAGIALYWGEGSKKQVGFSNSDPKIIKFMMKWFRKVHQVPDEKINLTLYLYPEQDEQNLKEYWSEVTDLPLDQFYKSIFKQKGVYQKDAQDEYKGTLKIRICNQNLRHKITAWIEQVRVYLTS